MVGINFLIIQTVCSVSSDNTVVAIDLLNPSCMPCMKISNANAKAYFSTDFSYIQPAIKLIESYITWLNITKEVTLVFTDQKGKFINFNYVLGIKCITITHVVTVIN